MRKFRNAFLNYLIAAALFCFLLIFFIFFVSEILYFNPDPDKQAYTLTKKEEAFYNGNDQLASFLEKLEKKSRHGNIERGRKIYTNICAHCHSIVEGGRNLIGPNLWKIFKSPIGSVEGFRYSHAMRNLKYQYPHSRWNFKKLDSYLLDPTKAIPGTIMYFSGIKDLQDRADLILYLHKFTSSSHLTEEKS